VAADGSLHTRTGAGRRRTVIAPKAVWFGVAFGVKACNRLTRRTSRAGTAATYRVYPALRRKRGGFPDLCVDPLRQSLLHWLYPPRNCASTMQCQALARAHFANRCWLSPAGEKPVFPVGSHPDRGGSRFFSEGAAVMYFPIPLPVVVSLCPPGRMRVYASRLRDGRVFAWSVHCAPPAIAGACTWHVRWLALPRARRAVQ